MLWGDGTPTREFLYVEDAAEAISWRPRSVTTAPSRSTSGAGEEISIRDLAELVADVTGFAGEIIWDTVQAERPAAPAARRLARRGALRLPRQDAAREGLERTVAWYRDEALIGAAAG